MCALYSMMYIRYEQSGNLKSSKPVLFSFYWVTINYFKSDHRIDFLIKSVIVVSQSVCTTLSIEKLPIQGSLDNQSVL